MLKNMKTPTSKRITECNAISVPGRNAHQRARAKFWLLFSVFCLLALAPGCTSLVNTPQGKILSVTERGLGFHIKTTGTTTETPDVVFGFWSSAVVVIPTSTNVPTLSPNFANTFDFGQNGALSQSISENIASGSYQTLTPGQTNAVVATQPIVPK